MPPVTTTLDQVLRRGKRRLLVQRAGSVAVVAAIGVGVMLMRPGDDSGGVRVGDVPVSTTAQPPLPGWVPVDLPVTSDGSCAPATQQLGRGDVSLPSKQQVETAFVGAIGSTLDTMSSTRPTRMAQPRNYGSTGRAGSCTPSPRPGAGAASYR